jgi:hypothetical protein
MTNINDLITKLVEEGIEITIDKDMYGGPVGIYYDLNTGMKSHCYLTDADGTIKAYTRYDKVHEVEDYGDLLYIVKDCMHGRNYLAGAWLKLLVKEDMLKVVTTTTQEYL